MNDCKFTGRIVADPVMRKTKSGIDVCNFRIAVQRPGTKREDKITDFFNCVVWGGKDGPGRAGVIERFFHKGDGIVLSGVMEQREYPNKDGVTQTSYELNVKDFEFPMGRKSDGEQPVTAAANAQNTMPEGEDEVPF